jgi:dynein heavy chain 2
LRRCGKSFEPAAAKRASTAAAPLAAWVKANVKYAEVLERIAPLEAEEKILMRGLKAAEMEVETLGKGILSVEEQVI